MPEIQVSLLACVREESCSPADVLARQGRDIGCSVLFGSSASLRHCLALSGSFVNTYAPAEVGRHLQRVKARECFLCKGHFTK